MPQPLRHRMLDAVLIDAVLIDAVLIGAVLITTTVLILAATFLPRPILVTAAGLVGTVVVVVVRGMRLDAASSDLTAALG